MGRFSKRCVFRQNLGAVKTGSPVLVLKTGDVVAGELARGGTQSILIDGEVAMELIVMRLDIPRSERVNALSAEGVAVSVSTKEKTKDMEKQNSRLTYML